LLLTGRVESRRAAVTGGFRPGRFP
jgi:hypothetical protein